MVWTCPVESSTCNNAGRGGGRGGSAHKFLQHLPSEPAAQRPRGRQPEANRWAPLHSTWAPPTALLAQQREASTHLCVSRMWWKYRSVRRSASQLSVSNTERTSGREASIRLSPRRSGPPARLLATSAGSRGGGCGASAVVEAATGLVEAACATCSRASRRESLAHLERGCCKHSSALFACTSPSGGQLLDGGGRLTSGFLWARFAPPTMAWCLHGRFEPAGAANCTHSVCHTAAIPPTGSPGASCPRFKTIVLYAKPKKLEGGLRRLDVGGRG